MAVANKPCRLFRRPWVFIIFMTQSNQEWLKLMEAKNEHKICFNKNGNKIDTRHIDRLGVKYSP
jgi:hypothetical protein